LSNSDNIKFNRQEGTLSVELFQVDNVYYAFDFNKVIFLEINKVIFEVLSALKKNINRIDKIIKYLSQFSDWEIQDAVNEIVMYQRDGYFKPIDFQRSNPLLAFPKIKRIVSILKDRFLQRNQELMIAVTSNGTVMNEEIIDFFVENNILLQLSIDGSQTIHDSYRKFNGSDLGSFDTVLKNLRLIFDRNSGYYMNNLRLKVVINSESMDISYEDFFDIPLINALIEKKKFIMIDKTPHYDLSKDDDYFVKINKLSEFLFQKEDVSTIKELLEGLTYKNKNLYFATLHNFFDIRVLNHLHYDIAKPVPFSKDCLIGIEGVVNPDGSISICSNANIFIIGDVIEDAWYFEKIAEYDKLKYSLINCKKCFAQRFCSLCYEKINHRDIQLDSQVENFCNFTRYYYRTIFGIMLKILNKNPKLWDVKQSMAEERKNEILRKLSEKK